MFKFFLVANLLFLNLARLQLELLATSCFSDKIFFQVHTKCSCIVLDQQKLALPEFRTEVIRQLLEENIESQLHKQKKGGRPFLGGPCAAHFE